MRTLALTICLVMLPAFPCCPAATPWSEHGPLTISDDGRFLRHADGTPFFWQGDTAWGVFRNSFAAPGPGQPVPLRVYFATRAAQGFNVVQASLLPVNASGTNAYGHQPFHGGTDPDFARPLLAASAGDGGDYWSYVDRVIDLAADHGIYLAVVPAWNRHLDAALEVRRDPGVAYAYGQFLGRRFGDEPNIVWMLGGDIDVRDPAYYPLNDAMAEGISDGVNGVDRHDGAAAYGATLMTLHPRAAQSSKDAEHYRRAPWMDFDSIQSAITHDRIGNANRYHRTWARLRADYRRAPLRPTFDAEVSYEDSWRAFGLDRSAAGVDTIPITAWEARRSGYLSVFAGAFGYSYGHRNLIRFLRQGQTAGHGADGPWYASLGRAPGTGQAGAGSAAGAAAEQIRHLRALLHSRSLLQRIPDNTLVAPFDREGDGYGDRVERVQVTRAGDGSFALVYISNGRTVQVNLAALAMTRINAWWYSPRDGVAHAADGGPSPRRPFLACRQVPRTGRLSFDPPGDPAPPHDPLAPGDVRDHRVGNDWVLVLDDAAAGYPVPGRSTGGELVGCRDRRPPQ